MPRMSEGCLIKAYKIYDAHEYAHAALSLVARRTPEHAEDYLNLVNKELYKATLSVEDKMELNDYLSEARGHIRSRSPEAIAPLNRFLDKTKELMFEVAVECAGGK